MKKSNPLSTAIILMLIETLIFIFCMKASSQDVRTTLGLYSDPNATRIDGFNIGMTLDYQRQIGYNKVNIFWFPNLRGLDYFEVSATVLGFNKHIGYFKIHRLHAGFKLGAVFRESSGTPNPMLGFESGYECYITPDFYIGVLATQEYRTDNKVWNSQAQPFWRGNGYFKIGFKL